MDNHTELVLLAIKDIYLKDIDLINKDLCERCLVHRLAVYLEDRFNGYYVDCEFNKSFYENYVGPKYVSNKINGNYIDIIVHKRSNNPGENLLCFEVKKVNNYKDRNKDKENLEILTGESFCYTLGFFICLGKSFETTSVEVYSNGRFMGILQH